MMKKTISFILVIAMLCTMLSTTCFAALDYGASYNDFLRDDRSVKNSEGETIYKVYYDYPVMNADNTHADKINAAIYADRERFFEAAKLLVTEPGGNSASGENPYISVADTWVTKNSDGILSMQVATEWYAGGAHIKGYYGLNFDINTGNPLTLAEAFNMTETETLAYVKNKTYEFIELNASEFFEDAKTIAAEYEIEDYEFYLDDTNVYICYPVYELAPGATGPVVVECPITNRRIRLVLNSNILFFDEMPVIKEGRTLVPLRGIFEALGATVEWDDDTRTVVSEKDGTKVSITIGEKEMYVDGEIKTLDVSACIINDRTMVPVRAVAEAFGCYVEWEDETKTVYINQLSYENTPEGVAKAYLKACSELDVYAIMEMVTLPSSFELYVDQGIVDIRSMADATCEQIGLKDLLSDAVYEKYLDMMTRITENTLAKSTFEFGEYEYFSDEEVKIEAVMSTPDTSALTQEAIRVMQEEIALRANLEAGESLTDEQWFEIIDIIEEVLTKKFDELEMTETTGEVPVVKRDGRWMVYVG